MELLDTLKTIELVSRCELVQVIKDCLLEIVIINIFLEGFKVFSLSSSPFLDATKIRYNNSNKIWLKTITVDKDLSNKSTLNVNILEFLWSNIFTLSQLKDVLCSINNFN